MKLAVVEWVDSMGGNSWTYIKDELGNSHPTLHSVGWVLESPKTHVLLGSSLHPKSKQVGQTMSIPRGCIKKITYVGSKYTIKS